MKYKTSHFGFTLVELIVGITISMLLMVSVGVFVSGGMQNIFLQQKVFENAGDFVNFNTSFLSSLDSMDSGFTPEVTSNSLLFKSQAYFAHGGYNYMGTGSQLDFYCSDPTLTVDERTTNHLFIKNFIPYFETSESDMTDIETASVGIYTSYVKRHVVEDSAGNILVGKETFGSTVGTIGTETYLNSPTGLAFHNNILFISDTLNNRILAYNTLPPFDIEVLLDETDGINEPTGLTMSGASLLIANSGAGEILEYSSDNLSNYPGVTLNVNQNNVERFDIEVYHDNTPLDIGLNVSHFTNFSSPYDFFQVNSNIGEYIFTNYNGAESAWTGCTLGSTRYNSGNPQRCSATDIGRAGLFSQTISNIDIASVSGVPASGNYYIRLQGFNSIGTSIYQNYFPYFTQGDGDLLTRDDNTLSVIDSGLDYPFGWDSGNNIREFDTSFIAGLGFNFDATHDSVLKTPIEDFNIDFNSDLLSIDGTYYKNYDCYNSDNRITREFIWKKTLQ